MAKKRRDPKRDRGTVRIDCGSWGNGTPECPITQAILEIDVRELGYHVWQARQKKGRVTKTWSGVIRLRLV